MKHIAITTYILLFGYFKKAQGLESLKFKDAKKQLESKVDSLEKNKPLNDYNGGWIARLEKEFFLDTFYLENLRELEIDYNGSTIGMNLATYKAEKAYDRLLNKYYKKLLDILADEDKQKK